MKKINSSRPPEQDEAWQSIIKDVIRLPQPEETPQAPLIIDEIIPSVDYKNAYGGNKLDNISVGSTDNIDRSTAEKFKRGLFKIEKRLDLHGLTENDAYNNVIEFIKSSYIKNLRCILIVTGKGSLHEDDDIFSPRGVLKDRVPVWLNSDELRPLILSFSYSLPKDGGEGALYILLRRKRK